MFGIACLAGRIFIRSISTAATTHNNYQNCHGSSSVFPMFGPSNTDSADDNDKQVKEKRKSESNTGRETSGGRQDGGSSNSDKTPPSPVVVEKQQEQPLSLSTGMVASIEFYKQFISPLLPPACRFVPTCSRYGVQAIQEFGPGKGAILIAWRLLRCSPVGGKGYDPPKWPPVPYTYSSY
ncbi:hypothetical protein ACA910_022231 [Epithemia clementina (nom. ined.)]